jgi:hypothetical protein
MLACCKFNCRFIVQYITPFLRSHTWQVSVVVYVFQYPPSVILRLKSSQVKISVDVFHAFNIHQPSLSVTSMWPKTHVETFRWCLLEKNTVLKRNHIVRTCFYVCMYVCIYAYPYQTHKTTIPNQFGFRQKPKVAMLPEKQKLVRIKLCNPRRYTHQPISNLSTKCLMEVLPQWNKKVGINILHVSISTKLRCYLQYKYWVFFKKQQNIAITLIRCYLKFCSL